MTTLTRSSSDSASSGPGGPDRAAGTTGPRSAARLRAVGQRLRSRRRPPLPPHLRTRRRRLLLASMPVAVLLALVAVRLLTLNLVHAQTLDAYRAGDKPRTLLWGERQGWVNVVEQFRSPFAIGDAHVLAGHYELARPWFEAAFEQVPKGGIDECKVRVNLGLTYEALGDAAKARERTTEWKQFYDKGIKITKERPPLCDAPEGGQTGEQLEQAEQRMQQKNDGEPSLPDQAQPKPGPQPTPSPAPTPDADKTPSQQQQDLLKEQQRRNTIERNERRGDDDRGHGGDTSTVPKPW
jgi:hypothetical protein